MASRSILALGLSLVVAAVIAFLTLTPISAPQLQSFQEGDKIYHAIAFAGLVLPVALFRPDRLLVAIPVHAAFGGLIEIIQPFVGRERSFHDWIADLVGIGIGLALVWPWQSSYAMRRQGDRPGPAPVHGFQREAGSDLPRDFSSTSD